MQWQTIFSTPRYRTLTTGMLLSEGLLLRHLVSAFLFGILLIHARSLSKALKTIKTLEESSAYLLQL